MFYHKYIAKTKLDPSEIMTLVKDNIYNMPELVNISASVNKFEGVVGKNYFSIWNSFGFLMGHCVVTGEISKESNYTRVILKTRLPMEDLIVLIPIIIALTLNLFDALKALQYFRFFGGLAISIGCILFLKILYQIECKKQIGKLEKILQLKEIKKKTK